MNKEETFEANFLCLNVEDINLSSSQTVNTMTAVPFIPPLVQLKAVNDIFVIFAPILFSFTLINKALLSKKLNSLYGYH